jgi:hypothetical protein
MSFDKNVFVNCPFDKDYSALLKALLFCIIYVGMRPTITLQKLDSGETRIEKIISLIKSSKFAIHDLSRSQATRVGEYFRLNMPLELGIDIGCKKFKGGKWAKKKCLILESKDYRHHASISDLSNSDIKVHKGNPIDLVRHVRDWLNNQARLNAPGPSRVWKAYNSFESWLYVDLKKQGYSNKDYKSLPTDEFMSKAQKWCKKYSV